MRTRHINIKVIINWHVSADVIWSEHRHNKHADMRQKYTLTELCEINNLTGLKGKHHLRLDLRQLQDAI